MTKVIARVISQKGKCDAGHKVGDEFEVSQQNLTCGICPWAMNALFPFTATLLFGGSFPWEKEPSKAKVACPDPDNPVIFELRRAD